MTHQDDLQPAGTPEDQPTMELLEGAESAAPSQRSIPGRLLRGSLYGVLLLSASALLAISAVPELANYATFIPDTKAGYQCSSQSGSCSAMNVAALQGSPCCPNSEAAVASASGCSSSCDKSELLASVAAGLKSCCAHESLETDVQVVDEAPAQTLLTDEQLALLPEGEVLD